MKGLLYLKSGLTKIQKNSAFLVDVKNLKKNYYRLLYFKKDDER